ncbi:MAG: thioredoxin domain-containing protein [Elusimicrobia bacterium]|nr:thioredoxin domain-containing protein [Elusimicrobiota bacterium]
MLPQTRTSRALFSGAALFLLSASLTAWLRLSAKPYTPQAPGYRIEGPSGAPMLLAEFSDFQCGGCRMAAEPLRQLKGLFPGKIRFLFKHFPWDFHPNARAAAIAAECAGRGGKFWVYHDMLFSRQQEWGEAKKPAEAFARFAKEAGVEAAPFASCLEDPAAAAAVDADVKEAKDIWVRATPTFFINGRRFVGVRQLRGNGFNLIERTLKKP